MKRLFAMLLALVCIPAMAFAEASPAISQSLGAVTSGSAELTVTIRTAGATDTELLREQPLEAVITSADGSLSQTFRYNASVSPVYESAAGFAMLDDLNFDGYRDLCFVTGQGARNVFHIFALWNAESGCFDPITEICPWLPDQNRFAESPSPLELCCYELLPETRQIVSDVADGFRYRTITAYGWEGEREICEDSVASIYDAGEGVIGEQLVLFATQIDFCWNEVYPESWYYEQEGISEERLASLKAVMLGAAAANPVFMRVKSDTWVNLRLQDSTESRALAKLDAGAAVTVLQTACGSENGWVRVWVEPQAAGVDPLDETKADAGITGYVWHSFLENVR